METLPAEKGKLYPHYIDEIIEMIIDCKHYRDICAHFECKLSTFFDFISRPAHSARIKEARKHAASILVDEAERVLAQAKEDPRLFAVARELAHHYRWKASMLDRESYADKKTVIMSDEKPEQKKITINVKYDD